MIGGKGINAWRGPARITWPYRPRPFEGEAGETRLGERAVGLALCLIHYPAAEVTTRNGQLRSSDCSNRCGLTARRTFGGAQKSRTSILVTGGAGYIGSQTCKALPRAGFNPVNPEAVKWGALEIGDLADKVRLREVLTRYRRVAVIQHSLKNTKRRSLTSRHQNIYVLMMRTTLTLDDGVAATLEMLRRNRRIGLKQLINEALRRGLKEMGTRRGPRAPVRTQAVALGRLRISSIDNIGEALAIAEGESFK
jgi:NAD dependent epimerase/dehydratase family